MPNTAQIIRIIIIAMVFVVPVIIRIVKAANDAKERRRLEQLRQYQINEAMRTGRPIEPIMAHPMPTAAAPSINPNQPAQDRLREMAARRQAQIDALRAQRAQGAPVAPAPVRAGPTNAYQNQPNASPFPVVRQQTGQATPQQRPQPQRQPQRQTQPQRQPQPQQRQPQPQRGPTKAQRKQQAIDAQRAHDANQWQPTSQIGGSSHDHEGDVTHRLVPDAADDGAPRVTARTAPGTPKPKVALGDLRQAIILREVLGRPLALRDDRDAA